MLSQEQNDLLTRTGPGTPCGELMRRYWQPVALSEELEEGVPLSIKVLGEELVLFRDDEGRVGLLGLHCSHRGADLSLGRIEDGGLRCLYHGWLYDINGRCLEQPAELAGSDFKNKIRHKAYPCQEAPGIIFGYLGPGNPPLLPLYEPLTVTEDHRYCYKVFHDCNYLQAHEGEIDPAHLSYLHRRMKQPSWRQRPIKGSDGAQAMSFYRADTAPTIDLEETDFGVRIFSLRRADEGRLYLRVTNSILPNVSTIVGPMAGDGYDINWHVPIDDTHHWKYVIIFRRSGPLEARDWKNINSLRSEMTRDYRLVRNAANRYLQDRESMKSWNFSGIGTNNVPQDAAMVQSPGPIQDREAEHLGTTDKAIIANRKALLEASRAVEAGREPPHIIRDPKQQRVREVMVVSEIISSSEDWRHYWKKVARFTGTSPSEPI
jgi:phenylpropionate dioxygenase-like ring-hydroxylating dioxygenase large terminal subunit